MTEFLVRRATAADVDRLWPLFDEVEGEQLMLADDGAVQLAESRRAAIVEMLLDETGPVLVAYSGIRAVGYILVRTGEPPYVSESWRGLGVEAELEQACAAYRSQ